MGTPPAYGKAVAKVVPDPIYSNVYPKADI